MTASSRRKLRAIVLGIFNKRQHNRQYMRLIWRYLSGKSLKDWTAENAIKYNYAFMISYFMELTQKYKSKIMPFCEICQLSTIKKMQEIKNKIFTNHPRYRPFHFIIDNSIKTNIPIITKNNIILALYTSRFDDFIREVEKFDIFDRLVVSINGKIPLNTDTITQVYDKYKSDCGFVHITYSLK